ncbi:thermonuclease family protein [Candidatus Woesearchaeota archaeon]|nr:thermonuclease family protein [Candidatus Woesearchaeota archaeon]
MIVFSILFLVLFIAGCEETEQTGIQDITGDTVKEIVIYVEEKNEEQPKIKAESGEESQDLDNIVTMVIDGDTIGVGRGKRVRLICIDTPEAGQPYYKEAKTYLTDLILNKEVKLVKDVSETDRYGRLLRYVYAGNTFVNGELVKKGYARVYRYPPDTKLCSHLETLERDAKNNNLGIWSEIKEEQEKGHTPNLGYICSYNAYNCNDFATHAKAQAVYESCGGVSHDVHRLDRDKDGLACESLY